MEGLLTMDSDALQWHRKFGHLSYSNMEKLTSLSDKYESNI